MLSEEFVDDLLNNYKIKLNRDEVLELYNKRCIRCLREFTLQVHEIEYKSARPKTWMWWENQVTLCYDCHSFMHAIGSKKSEILLHDLQNKRLTQYYGRVINRI